MMMATHKGKHLIGASLQLKGLFPFHHGEEHAGKCGAGEGVESSIS